MKLAHTFRDKVTIFYRNNIVLRSFFHLLSLSTLITALGILVRIPFLKNLVHKHKLNGIGSSTLKRKEESIVVEIVAINKEGKVKKSRITLPEIYETTAILLCESCLLFIDKLDAGTIGYSNDGRAPAIRGGVITPAFALGQDLIERLQPSIKFEKEVILQDK